ncbi:hypothetical protein HJFPF1_00898 [Paramyrothecium foliicola]|nr:hypothetical protein HJFPF1_00898 [Paramyrothecium foliicola]
MTGCCWSAYLVDPTNDLGEEAHRSGGGRKRHAVWDVCARRAQMCKIQKLLRQPMRSVAHCSCSRGGIEQVGHQMAPPPNDGNLNS